jgi:hypothetical protein
MGGLKIKAKAGVALAEAGCLVTSGEWKLLRASQKQSRE